MLFVKNAERRLLSEVRRVSRVILSVAWPAGYHKAQEAGCPFTRIFARMGINVFGRNTTLSLTARGLAQ